MADAASHIFLPWVQTGVAANMPDAATERLAADQAAVISLPVQLTVNTSFVDKTVRFYGPGDVIGLDPEQVVRYEPLPGTADFEPHCFPAIEFDRADFPWLFTPARPDSQGRLRPWLVLVVVRQQPGVALLPPRNQSLPMLEIKTPARPGVELADLSESYLWAHAQVTGVERSDLAAALASEPGRTVSRLLAPRRLDPLTDYVACVVPAFEVGRQAGLGQTVSATTLEPAWASGADAPAEILLPVYVSWTFRTGAARDFEALARRLKPNQLPPDAGKRAMDISRPGFVMSPDPSTKCQPITLGLEGALRPLGGKSDEWPNQTRLPFQTALASILGTPWELSTTAGSHADPILAPPVYGCWHAAAHIVSPSPGWLNELNLDPRLRASAAMGTQVIQQQQEQLMASAWAQLGDIERINQRLRQAQLSRAVNTMYHAKALNRLSEGVLMNVIAPAQSRVTVSDQTGSLMLAQMLAGSPVPAAALSVPLRRMLRPRGAMNRRYVRAGVRGIQPLFTLFNVTTTGLQADPTRGAITVDAVSSGIPTQIAIVRDHRTGEVRQELFVQNPGPPPFLQRPTVGLLQMIQQFRPSSLWSGALQFLPTTSPDFAAAVRDHHQYLSTLFTAVAGFSRFSVDAVDLKAAVLARLAPAATVADAAQSAMDRGSPGLLSGDALDPIMDAPSFPQPMYEALRVVSQDFFPGLERVPPDTVQLLQSNPKFIESFMVGLNTEMGRELLWRGYPTDQRGTYFQNFWDRTPSPGATPTVDIPPIHQWGARALGTTAVGGDATLVLLIRGELLRRYPGTIIYAIKALMHDGRRVLATDFPSEATAPTEAYPVFRGTLDPDVTFLGFDLTKDEAVADPGWFFVLQQQPTEPRFGLDEAPFEENPGAAIPPLRTWNDLSWAHLAANAEQLKAISNVVVRSIDLVPTQPVTGTWGRNSGHMAYITRQLPVRVAIHATDLIP